MSAEGTPRSVGVFWSRPPASPASTASPASARLQDSTERSEAAPGSGERSSRRVARSVTVGSLGGDPALRRRSPSGASGASSAAGAPGPASGSSPLSAQDGGADAQAAAAEDAMSAFAEDAAPDSPPHPAGASPASRTSPASPGPGRISTPHAAVAEFGGHIGGDSESEGAGRGLHGAGRGGVEGDTAVDVGSPGAGDDGEARPRGGAGAEDSGGELSCGPGGDAATVEGGGGGATPGVPGDAPGEGGGEGGRAFGAARADSSARGGALAAGSGVAGAFEAGPRAAGESEEGEPAPMMRRAPGAGSPAEAAGRATPAGPASGDDAPGLVIEVDFPGPGVLVERADDPPSVTPHVRRAAHRITIHLLCEAAARGDRGTLRSIVDSRACGLNAVNVETGRNALHETCANGHAKLARILLRHGAEPGARTVIAGLSALHLAASHGHVECLESVLDAGGNIEWQDRVRAAAARVPPPRARWLTPVTPQRGATALHYAASEAVATALLDRGADTLVADRRGQTPYAAQARAGRSQVALAIRMREVEDYARAEVEKRSAARREKMLEQQRQQEEELRERRAVLERQQEQYKQWRQEGKAAAEFTLRGKDLLHTRGRAK